MKVQETPIQINLGQEATLYNNDSMFSFNVTVWAMF